MKNNNIKIENILKNKFCRKIIVILFFLVCIQYVEQNMQYRGIYLSELGLGFFTMLSIGFGQLYFTLGPVLGLLVIFINISELNSKEKSTYPLLQLVMGFLFAFTNLILTFILRKSSLYLEDEIFWNLSFNIPLSIIFLIIPAIKGLIKNIRIKKDK